jgi:fumarate reductase subunit D
VKKLYKKYGAWIIAMLLLCWITLTPYPFQKGGLDETIYYFIIASFVILISGLITLLFEDFNKVERSILTIVLSIGSLLIMSLFIMPHVENLFSGDYAKFFWQTKDRVLINVVFYGMNSLFIIAFCWSYILNKRHRKRKLISDVN